jgi:hypothetical protein
VANVSVDIFFLLVKLKKKTLSRCSSSMATIANSSFVFIEAAKLAK